MSVTLDVFVSSPGDLVLERRIVGEAVARLARQAHIRRSCALRAHFYESMVPPVVASSAQAAVNTFMMDPARCDVMVCLLGGRLGTPFKDPEIDDREYRSGTEFEIVRAAESTKRPKPAVLLYYRARQGMDGRTIPVEPVVEEFLRDFEGNGARFRGIVPAPFVDAGELREKVYEGLNAVVTPLVQQHVARRWAVGVAATAALAGAIAASYGLAAWREKARGAAEMAALERRRADESAQAAATARREQATAVLDAVSRGDWAAVETLDRLGCAAVAPLLETLAEVHGQAAGHMRSTVVPLRKLTAREGGERCGCAALFSVLSLENAVVKYSKDAHRIVLEELGRLGDASACRNRDSLVCDYLGKIQPLEPLIQVVLEKQVDTVADLNAAAGKWLGQRKLDSCIRTGRLP